uniref:Uncharacterized protein n=1 Tax=Timspurckia oligopyrenoides TaxID=708627 RepID=A0A7S0ZEU2_9RHOD|mmetsp:Transcript_2543/g.4471  ORF Transcript_2543/g.4471 Transcript_2543/m.4471 type:complete len:537 (+) Transcript_2543:44-1654(+)
MSSTRTRGGNIYTNLYGPTSKKPIPPPPSSSSISTSPSSPDPATYSSSAERARKIVFEIQSESSSSTPLQITNNFATTSNPNTNLSAAFPVDRFDDYSSTQRTVSFANATSNPSSSSVRHDVAVSYFTRTKLQQQNTTENAEAMVAPVPSIAVRSVSNVEGSSSSMRRAGGRLAMNSYDGVSLNGKGVQKYEINLNGSRQQSGSSKEVSSSVFGGKVQEVSDVVAPRKDKMWGGIRSLSMNNSNSQHNTETFVTSRSTHNDGGVTLNENHTNRTIIVSSRSGMKVEDRCKKDNTSDDDEEHVSEIEYSINENGPLSPNKSQKSQGGGVVMKTFRSVSMNLKGSSTNPNQDIDRKASTTREVVVEQSPAEYLKSRRQGLREMANGSSGSSHGYHQHHHPGGSADAESREKSAEHDHGGGDEHVNLVEPPRQNKVSRMISSAARTISMSQKDNSSNTRNTNERIKRVPSRNKSAGGAPSLMIGRSKSVNESGKSKRASAPGNMQSMNNKSESSSPQSNSRRNSRPNTFFSKVFRFSKG